MGKAKSIPVARVVPIKIPIGLYNSIKYLTTIKDSKGEKHSFDSIVVSACNLFLLSVQTYSDNKKSKSTKKMN